MVLLLAPSPAEVSLGSGVGQLVETHRGLDQAIQMQPEKTEVSEFCDHHNTTCCVAYMGRALSVLFTLVYLALRIVSDTQEIFNKYLLSG